MSIAIALIQNLTNDVCFQLEHDPEFELFKRTQIIGDYKITG